MQKQRLHHFVIDPPLMMAQSRAESTRDTYNYGQYINQFPPNTIKVIRQYERIQKKICLQKMSIIFNEICIYILIYIIHIYIYIYIYKLKIYTYELFDVKTFICIIIDFTLNNPPWLMFHKIQPNQILYIKYICIKRIWH